MSSSLRMDWILRIAVAGCFIGHGFIAVVSSGNFVSAWSGWVMSILPEDYKYEGSRLLLSTIGAIDIVAGLSMLLSDIPLVSYIWIVTWGFATALSRVYFLGQWSEPYGLNLVNPVAEFLIRAPNWICPVVLTRMHFPAAPIISRVRWGAARWFAVGSTCVSAAMFLHYAVELNKYAFKFELDKIAKPLWYFHAEGAIAALALIVWIAFWFKTRLERDAAIAALITILAYGLSEGFEVLWLNAPHGFTYAGIRLIEHFTVYALLVLVVLSKNSRCNAVSTIR